MNAVLVVSLAWMAALDVVMSHSLARRDMGGMSMGKSMGKGQTASAMGGMGGMGGMSPEPSTTTEPTTPTTTPTTPFDISGLPFLTVSSVPLDDPAYPSGSIVFSRADIDQWLTDNGHGGTVWEGGTLVGRITSGPGAGQIINIDLSADLGNATQAVGNATTGGFGLGGVRPGDRIVLDNILIGGVPLLP